MDANQPSSAEQHFVEEVGLFFEQWGGPRMAGRILGWLLICDPPYQSMGEVADALMASKGSISTMTRLLIQLGLIERTARPGQRRDYVQIRPGIWIDALGQRMRAVAAYRALAERGLALLDNSAAERGERLREMRDIFAFFERELPLLIERWKQEQSAREMETPPSPPKT